MLSDSGIPREARQLIEDYIDSVLLLEILLFLRAEPGKARTAADISAALSIEVRWGQQRLDYLHEKGLLAPATPTTDSATDNRYRYAPESPALAVAVDSLALAYRVRRVAVIRYITERSTGE